MQIGRHVRKTRKALGLNQSELAQEVKVTPQHISKLELEQATPSLETLLSLSRTLGVSTDYLLTGREVAPVDIRGAIRSQQQLSPVAKRTLIQLIGELDKTS
jgi:transcriptional regulator with XRE-family HTH domain